jgi:hypothetical protein
MVNPQVGGTLARRPTTSRSITMTRMEQGVLTSTAVLVVLPRSLALV